MLLLFGLLFLTIFIFRDWTFEKRLHRRRRRREKDSFMFKSFSVFVVARFSRYGSFFFRAMFSDRVAKSTPKKGQNESC